MKYKITALPGDGIGPEIMESGLGVLKAIEEVFGHQFQVTKRPFGGAGIDAEGDPLSDKTLNACKESEAILLGAIGGPKWQKASKTPEMGLLQLRKALGLYANIRPIQVPTSIAHLSPLKAEIVSGSDFVVVRELTGGIYFGEPKHWNDKEALDSLVYTREEIRRICVQAFEIAQGRKKKVTSVDKANVLSSSKLWRKVVAEVAQDYPDVTLEHLYVDAAAMLIIQKPTTFDVIVTENLFGDILSDEASVITGSLGMLPSASHGIEGPSVYEPIHGSAPDIAGKNCANPMSMILSVAMMLRESFSLISEAAAIEAASNTVMESGILTTDLGGTATTTEFTEAVRKQIIEGGRR